MRQIVLDTETTGLEVEAGHRILEIGCVEIIGRKLTRRHYHQYINPERESDDGALEVHGITSQFLKDKPVFADVWNNFLDFVDGSQLIIHNAAFDIGFLNHEMRLLDSSLGMLTDYCTVIDSLALAKSKHPGQKNNLNALCKRYSVDNSQRQLHGALLDAEILADVYLLLTGGQATLGLGEDLDKRKELRVNIQLDKDRAPLKVMKATFEELRAHERKLDHLDEISSEGAVWRICS